MRAGVPGDAVWRILASPACGELFGGNAADGLGRALYTLERRGQALASDTPLPDMQQWWMAFDM